MKAYKGFNKDMTCREFKFEEGKTYEESEAILCKRGFHACTNPIDVFTYYPPATSVYHEVELDDVSKGEEEDTKICGRKIKIGKQLNFNDMIHKGFEISMQLYGENIDNSHAVTAEYGEWNGKTYPVLCVKCGKIDGVSLKPDTWYQLKNGEFVEV